MTEKLISIVPDRFSLTVGEASSDIELDSVCSTAHKCAKVSSTCFIRLMTGSFGSSKFRDSCFVSIVHSLLEADDHSFGVFELFDLEQVLLTGGASTHFVGCVRAAQDYTFITVFEAVRFKCDQLFQIV